MKAHYLITGLLLVLLSAGCIHPGVNDSYVPTEVTPLYHPTDTVTGHPDNVRDLRHTSRFRFDGWENPANYTRFCPPSYVPEGYVLYDLLLFGVLNETAGLNYTVVGEKLRYALNSTIDNASWTTDITFLEVSWSEHGSDPYEKDEILGEDPKPVDINGSTGWIYEIEQNRLIVWTAGNATYQVYGSLDREELLRVARSIVCGGDIGFVSDV
ncbi:DUF4367 domain-containing protein [Methanogenium cariaci]|jgi:uncharacterized protein DUF4367